MDPLPPHVYLVFFGTMFYDIDTKIDIKLWGDGESFFERVPLSFIKNVYKI